MNKNEEFLLQCLEVSKKKLKSKLEISFTQKLYHNLGCLTKYDQNLSNLLDISKEKLDISLDAINVLKMKDKIKNFKKLMNIDKKQRTLLKYFENKQISSKDISNNSEDFESDVNKIVGLMKSEEEFSKADRFLFSNLESKIQIEVIKRLRKDSNL